MMYEYSSMISCNATLPGPSLQSLCSAARFVCFMTALNEKILKNPKISRTCERVKPIEIPDTEYDFIVAGGGGGGAAVAGGLAKVTGWNILVLDAGRDASVSSEIPSFWEKSIEYKNNWQYYTTNESHACLSTNGSCFWPSAKCLGGNTAQNAMLYFRGNPTDYNRWAQLGNDGWEWEKVFKYFKKQENNANINEVGYDYHGTRGPLSVEFFPSRSKLAEPFLKASEQSGFGVSRDLNGEKLTGFTISQGMQRSGVRVSSATAHLQPHRNKKKLHIMFGAFVTKIIIENKKAVGVEFMKDGKLRCVYARKEVIISMGAIRSPQILLLSGIGSTEQLKPHGIPVVSDLPGVGMNLQDHLCYFIYFSINEIDAWENNVQVAKQYLKNQTGPMSTNAADIVGAGCTNNTSSDYPDVQFTISAPAANCAPGKVGALRSDGKRKIRAAVAYVHPKSRGRISLASDNPFDNPVIRANYMSDKGDLEGIIDGIEILLYVMKAEALQKYNFTLTESPEACSHYKIPSREYWACAVQQATATLWHWVGTCKMGPASDPMAVVDPKLRVHGIKNLRVADASIMPEIPSANTGAPTMMIGYRVADFIKEFWLSSSEWLKHTEEDC